ncbi:ATP-dependent translocase ABCB1-like isoform X1 [Dendroctonus ponderosae]|uniref:ATP-dependent translocase ABCB1-like isoform X1 n=1 Tax=Dendroctonus ponderosae TaxID=77166 RepID=UPI002035D443|nr:ATP-dependent translocase ABCB1-like isoform X1 [Dendroctonus ponderosae]
MTERHDGTATDKERASDVNVPPIDDPESTDASSFTGLYRFATRPQKCVIIIGAIIALICGALQPLNHLLFGDLTQIIIEYSEACLNPNSTNCSVAGDNLSAGIKHFGIWSSINGVAIMITGYLATEAFSYNAIKQVFRVRSLYLQKLLNKDISWFDVHNSGDFSSRMADDLSKFEDGIGEKVPLFLTLQGSFISAITLALVKGWELALICLISLPVSFIAVGLIAYLTTQFSKKELDAYAEAGSIAEEVITSIRTVIGFGGEKLETQRYEKNLIFAKDNNIRRHFFEGIGYGMLWLCIFSSYGLAFWYGIKLMLDGNPVYTPGNMLTVFFSVMAGSMSFGSASPFIEAFATAKAAGRKIFHMIKTSPIINQSKNNGAKLAQVRGNIKLQNVKFQYPSRKDVPVLQGIDLEIQAGDTVALVGRSGCGKSTLLQLVQRFYDPLQGQVFIDEKDVKELDLSWYRQYIGVVSQEPVLFGTTIAENIKYGNRDATELDIVQAAKMANAHQFIKGLPGGYHTLVGERGAQLSGGQKQRIAIARALVRNPAILLLDEATSALDTNSEAKVQAALDRASEHRTTIIVAHRLSTIRGANKIVVISDGKVVEQGTHEDLMELKNEYYALVTTQVHSSEQFENIGEASEKKIFDSVEDDDEDFAPKRVNLVRMIKVAEINHEALKETDEESEVDNYVKTASLWSIVKLNSPEWLSLFLGCFGAAVMGTVLPIFAVLLGSILQVLQDSDKNYVRQETNKYILYFVLAGVLAMFATFLQLYMFGRAGENLTLRMRSRMFDALLKQEMGYFDRNENGVGSLCAKLSNEASQVQGATGQRIGAIVNSLATLILSVFFAVYYEWRLGLVAMVFVPLIIAATFIQKKQMSQESDDYKESLEKSTKIAVEAVGSIRTVVSLGCEKTFFKLYISELMPHIKKCLRNTHARAFILGFSRAIMIFAFSACLVYGGYLIKHENVQYGVVFKVAQALIMGTVSIANSLAFTPNFEKGLVAARTVMNMINRIPKVSNSQNALIKNTADGNVNYSQIHFSYPTRDSIEVLKGLDLSVLQGKTVALVGPSGCGKSTIIHLLERFYDPASGTVSLDEDDIKSITLASLRSHLGIVSQEPNLFSRSIAENIAYGDNSRHSTDSEIIEAARKANIHNFITQLPEGYNTKLGEKGTQLSGGQKQRIAIARALIRHPKVLLLDEATSALDAESEKVVQDALDNAKQGRTCLTIAHRLTTIQDADLICVVNNGVIVEQGAHTDLIERNGLYYRLYARQHYFL